MEKMGGRDWFKLPTMQNSKTVQAEQSEGMRRWKDAE